MHNLRQSIRFGMGMEGNESAAERCLGKDVRNITKKLKVSKDTGSQLVIKFEKIGILKELTGKQRYKKYLFKDYVNIIAKGTK